jgi:cytochrome c oxidase subunit III
MDTTSLIHADAANARVGVDARALPRTAWGHATPIWWGMWSVMVIEGTVLLLLATVYLYLRRLAPLWPPAGIRPPALGAATANVTVLVASLIPTFGLHRAALRRNRRAVGWCLAVATMLTLVSIALRGVEFAHAHVWWDANAYGSIVWTILGAHASHLIAAALEDLLLCALVFFGAMEPTHFVSITVSAIYSYFVAAAWLPLYLLVYWLPRP